MNSERAEECVLLEMLKGDIAQAREFLDADLPAMAANELSGAMEKVSQLETIINPSLEENIIDV